MASIGLTTRSRVRGLLALILIALAAASLVACSGGDSGSKPTGSASSSAVAGTSTPNAQPTIAGSDFNFPDRGYAAVIPAGWHANPNSLLAGEQDVDTFFSPDTTDGVQSNISVTCEHNASNVNTTTFVQNRLGTLDKLGATDVQTLGETTVSGVQGEGVAYTLKREDTVITKIDLMFATPKCAWTIAASSAPSDAAKNGDVFATFVKAFRLLDTGSKSKG